MGDSGDYWRDHRDYVERKKRTMIECSGCGRKIQPWWKCIDCGEPGPKYKPKKNEEPK